MLSRFYIDNEMTLKKTAFSTVEIFFVFLPFIYFLQVITFCKYVALLPTLILLPASLLLLANIKSVRLNFQSLTSALPEILVLYFTFVSFLWSIYEGLHYGVSQGISIFIRFVAPSIIYILVSRFISLNSIYPILNIISITSVIVGIEIIYENICVRIYQQIPLFQYMSFDYVKALGSGEELQQYISYVGRPTGLLEHLHATSFFIGIGVLTSLTLYLVRGWRVYLAIFFIGLFSQVIAGARLPLLITIIGLIVMFLLLKSDSQIKQRLMKSAIVTLFVILVAILILSVLSFHYEKVRQYVLKTYVMVITRGDFAPGGDINLEKHVESSFTHMITAFQQHPQTIIFGAGPGKYLRDCSLSCEDFFIFQIFGQYGIIGGILFLCLFLIPLWYNYNVWHQKQCEGKCIFVFIYSLLLLFALSIFHSPVLQRKAIYPLFFLTLGAIGRFSFLSNEELSE
jgi:hypothetical protein